MYKLWDLHVSGPKLKLGKCYLLDTHWIQWISIIEIIHLIWIYSVDRVNLLF